MTDPPEDASFAARLRHDFKNSYYSCTMLYISLVVTLIFLAELLGWGVARACK